MTVSLVTCGALDSGWERDDDEEEEEEEEGDDEIDDSEIDALSDGGVLLGLECPAVLASAVMECGGAGRCC